MRRRPYGCGIEAALAVVGGKWKPIVLWHLSGDPRRFGELRRRVTGISEKMLIQQLREMEADGIVTRRTVMWSPMFVATATDSPTSTRRDGRSR